jgi:hypothetical protein
MKGELASWRFVDQCSTTTNYFVSYETISDLMTLQDQIDAFQKLIFSHFRGGANNECRIAALVPLVQESYGIYKFITSMLRAMHTSMLVQSTVLLSANNL